MAQKPHFSASLRRFELSNVTFSQTKKVHTHGSIYPRSLEPETAF